MGKLTIYLDAADEEKLLERLMQAMKNEGRLLSMSEVVAKHLKFSFNQDLKVVMGCKQ